MAVTIDQLPRDGNGIVRGLWRVFHKNPDYTGQIGMAMFHLGKSERPLYGKQLATLVSVIGGDIFIAPWEGTLPDGFVLPAGHSIDVPESALSRLETPPSITVVETPEETSEDRYDDLETEALRELARSRGLRVHWNAGRAKIISDLRSDDD